MVNNYPGFVEPYGDRSPVHRSGSLPAFGLAACRGKLVGIITDSDFVAVAINLLEQLELTEPLAWASDEDML